MTIDNYAPCPCGSGKKIKFCKCIDQPQEYEKIVRLIEGGQELAALDRINQMLLKTPSAAWLLAMKCELNFSLREMDSLRETSQRFLKVKPDNPLALTFRGLVGLLDDEPLPNVARTLLEGMSEAREGLPSTVIAALIMMCQSLRNSALAPLRAYWVQVLNKLLSNFEEELPESASATAPVPFDNILTDSGTLILDNPPGAPWTERVKELDSLLSTFRFAQAETKMRAILRDFPDQPSLLSKLLHIQCVLLDQEGATATARKLSNSRDLSEAERDYFAAVALDYDPTSLQITSQSGYFEIASDEAAIETAQAMPEAIKIEDEQFLRIMALSVEDEVPAKAAYRLNRFVKLESGIEYAMGYSTIVVFGKQTDRPARILLYVDCIKEGAQVFEDLCNRFQTGTKLEDPQKSRSMDYRVPLETTFANRETRLPLPEKEFAEAVVDAFLHFPLVGLNGLSPLEAVEQEPLRPVVRALLVHLEGVITLKVKFGTIDEIYRRLGMTRPQFQLQDGASNWGTNKKLDLVRVHIPSLTNDQLYRYLSVTASMNMVMVVIQAAKELLSRNDVEHPDQVMMQVFSYLAEATESVEECFELLGKLEELLAKHKGPIGQVVMRRASLLNVMGRAEEAGPYFIHAVTNYPWDPTLISAMQYAAQKNRERLAPIASADDILTQRLAQHEPAKTSGGILLPGQSEANADPSKSKLWLPGS